MKIKKLVCITLLFFLVGMLNFSPVIAASLTAPVNLAQTSTSEPDQFFEIERECFINSSDPNYQATPIYQDYSRSSPIIGTIPKDWSFYPAKSRRAEADGWVPIVAIEPKEGGVTKISGFFPTDGVGLFCAEKPVCSIQSPDPNYQGTPIYQDSRRSSPIIGTIPKGWNFYTPKSGMPIEVKGWVPIIAIRSQEMDVTKISGFFPTDGVNWGCAAGPTQENDRSLNPPKKKP